MNELQQCTRTSRIGGKLGQAVGTRGVGSWTSLLGILVALGTALTVSTAQADERLTEITWAHAAPESVRRFIVLVSPTQETTEQTRFIDVGKPTGQASGGTMQVFRAIVSMNDLDYVAVGAVGSNGLTTAMSSWSVMSPTRPGQPLVIEP